MVTRTVDEPDVTAAEDKGVGAEVDDSWIEDDVSMEGIEDDASTDEVSMGDAVAAVELAKVVVTSTMVAFADDVEEMTEVKDDFTDGEDDFTVVEAADLQSPKPTWQPVPQYSGPQPQYPLLEQQLPKIEFLQVSLLPDCVPQRAVVLHLRLRASAPRNGRAVMANRRAECIVNERGRNE